MYGWNDYLWPLIVTNSPEDADGGDRDRFADSARLELPEWNVGDGGGGDGAVAPVAVIVVMQRWFVKGLIETEK